MMMQGNFEEHAKKFVESQHDVIARLKLVTNCRESVEILHTAEYENFLKHLYPVFQNALHMGTPQFVECDEQKIRYTLLEIMNRLPINDTLRPYASGLSKLVMHILTTDNEENAIICLRIIFDIHKNFSPSLESEVQPFIHFFSNLYRNLPITLKKAFGTPRTQIRPDGSKAKVYPRSSESFKVLTECPLIVMLIFQLYPQYVETNIHNLIPLMMGALPLSAPRAFMPEYKPVYAEFIAAQVKTLSFLTYVLRGFADRMRPHQENLADSVIQLLRNCPCEPVTSRKELLVATRHILATEFRKVFYTKIDMLLDEKVLIGAESPANENIRPLAYSTLADLVHHVRAELTIPQLSKVIYIFSRNIHCSTLPLSIQTASVRLVLNLVDHIYKKQDPNYEGRSLLVRILSALVNKFETLRKYIPKIIESVTNKEKRLEERGDTWTIAYTPKNDEQFPEDCVREVKSLMYTMVFGLKTVAWCISNFRYSDPNKQKGTTALDEHECDVMTRFLANGLDCFKIYALELKFTREGESKEARAAQQEEKNVLEHFASVFTVMDIRSFRNVVSVQMETLFEQIVNNTNLPMLIIPQHFLSSSHVSKPFADILLSFLTKRMKDMADPSSQTATVMLNLFRVVFGSVTLFADNESVLRPYLNTIVSQATELATQVKKPAVYFALLRALFRSIGGGKFELLYKEFLPLLPDLLQGLMKMQRRGPDDIRDISIELCLTVPARLSSLLPFIPLLMKAVLFALKAKDEQVIKLGLRTLEFWVDNLNPDYLYPHMCSVLSDLMRSLCALLRPLPSPFGATALSVLGKLGGRNRRFFKEAFNIKFTEHVEEGLTLESKFSGHDDFTMPLDQAIKHSKAILTGYIIRDLNEANGTTNERHRRTKQVMLARRKENKEVEKDDSSAKQESFLFLRSCLLSMMDLEGDVFAAFDAVHAKTSKTLRNKKRSKKSTPAPAPAPTSVSPASLSGLSALTTSPPTSLPVSISPSIPSPTTLITPVPVPLSVSMSSSASPSLTTVPSISTEAKSKSSTKKTKTKAMPTHTVVKGKKKKAAHGYKVPKETSSSLDAENGYTKACAPSDNQDELRADRSRLRHAPQERVFKDLIWCMIIAGSDPDLKKVSGLNSNVCMHGLVRHFALVLSQKRGDLSPTEEINELDLRVFLDALVEALCEETRSWFTAAEAAMKTFIDTLVVIVGRKAAGDLPVVAELLSRLSHLCYLNVWEKRHAGSIGLTYLCDKLSKNWIHTNQAPLIRALTFTFQDCESERAKMTSAISYKTLDMIVKCCCVYALEEIKPASVLAKASTAVAAMEFDREAPALKHVTPVSGTTPTSSSSSSSSSSIISTDADGDVAMGGFNSSRTTDTAAAPYESGPTLSSSPPLPASSTNTAAPSAAAAASTRAITPASNTSGPSSSTTGTTTTPPSSTSSASQSPASSSSSSPRSYARSPTIRNLVSILAPELISGTEAVRASAHRLLALISELTGRSVPTILRPYRNRLMAPVLQQSLHAVPIGIRIGYISAATYCFSLRPPLVTVGELQYLLRDAINDVSQEDRTNSGSLSGRKGRAVLLTRLRVESIKLMSTALASDEIKEKANDYRKLKDQITKVFFRSLLSRSPEIVEVAKAGLKQAFPSDKKYSKDLLHQCLRPILLSIADHRLLSVPLLEGLSRLMELLSSHFNVTLGEKLLEHLGIFADVEKMKRKRYEALMDKSGKSSRIKPGDEVKVCASIINIFHLLPPAPSKFLKRLVDITLKLEDVLPTMGHSGGYGVSSSSPYRKPLTRFLSAMPEATAEFFLVHLGQPRLSHMFQTVVRSEEGGPVRKVLMKYPQNLIATTFNYVMVQRSKGVPVESLSKRTVEELLIQGVTLVHILSGFEPEWLTRCPEIMQCLLNVWDSPGRMDRLRHEEKVPLSHTNETKLIVQCMMRYCKSHRRKARVLWVMLSVFERRSTIDYTFLIDFYKEEIAEKYTNQEKKHVISEFLAFFLNPSKAAFIKVKALKYIIIPMLESTFKKRAKLIAAEEKTQKEAEAKAKAAAHAKLLLQPLVPLPMPMLGGASSSGISSLYTPITSSTSTLIHPINPLSTSTAGTTPITFTNTCATSSPAPLVNAPPSASTSSLITTNPLPTPMLGTSPAPLITTSTSTTAMDTSGLSSSATVSGPAIIPSVSTTSVTTLSATAAATITTPALATTITPSTTTLLPNTNVATTGGLAVATSASTLPFTTMPTTTSAPITTSAGTTNAINTTTMIGSSTTNTPAVLSLANTPMSAGGVMPLINAASSTTNASLSTLPTSTIAANGMMTSTLSATGRAATSTLSLNTTASTLPIITVPIPYVPFSRPDEVVDLNMVDIIIKQLLVPTQGTQGEELQIELLQLATLFIRYLHKELTSYRKDLIKFAWNYLKSDHTTSKHWAYVNVCRFIDVYDTPGKIVLQVYVALLRTYQPEARSLVRKAMDILMPALPRRLPAAGEGKFPAWIKWTKKIIVEEGHLLTQLIHIWNLIIRHTDLFYSSRSQFIPQMVNSLNKLGLPQNRPMENRKLSIDICELIIRWDKKCLRLRAEHKKQEEEERKRQAASSYSYLGTNFGSSTSLSTNTLYQPPKRLKTETTGTYTTPLYSTPSSTYPSTYPSTSPPPVNFSATNTYTNNLYSTTPTPITSTSTTPFTSYSAINQYGGTALTSFTVTTPQRKSSRLDREYRPNSVMMELVVTYLLRLGLMTCEVDETKFLSKRCLKMTKLAMEVWKGGDIKFAYIEKILAQPQLPDTTVIFNYTLKMLKILLEHQPPKFTLNNISSFHKIIMQCLKSDNEKIWTGLYTLLEKIVQLFPVQGQSASPEFSKFYRYLRDVLVNGFKNTETHMIHVHVGVMSVVSKHCPNYMSTHFGLFIKALQKLAKEHISKQAIDFNALRRDPKYDYSSIEELKVRQRRLVSTIVKAMQLIRKRLGSVSDHKKIYFATLSLLITQSNSIDILHDIAEGLGPWITGVGAANIVPLTMKEKLNFVTKMTRFEHLGNKKLLDKHLTTVLKLFQTQQNNLQAGRSELLSKLQRSFLLGLRSRKLTFRSQFTDLYQSRISCSLFDRLNYGLALQDWEPLSEHYWLTQCLDLILGVIEPNQALKSIKASARVPAIRAKATLASAGDAAGADVQMSIAVPAMAAATSSTASYIRDQRKKLKLTKANAAIGGGATALTTTVPSATMSTMSPVDLTVDLSVPSSTTTSVSPVPLPSLSASTSPTPSTTAAVSVSALTASAPAHVASPAPVSSLPTTTATSTMPVSTTLPLLKTESLTRSSSATTTGVNGNTLLSFPTTTNALAVTPVNAPGLNTTSTIGTNTSFPLTSVVPPPVGLRSVSNASTSNTYGAFSFTPTNSFTPTGATGAASAASTSSSGLLSLGTRGLKRDNSGLIVGSGQNMLMKTEGLGLSGMGAASTTSISPPPATAIDTSPLSEEPLSMNKKTDSDENRLCILVQHNNFLTKLRANTRTRDLLRPLRELIHHSQDLSHDMWVKLIPIAWSKMTAQDRESLSTAIVSLLSKDWHNITLKTVEADKRYFPSHHYPAFLYPPQVGKEKDSPPRNIIQALLEGFTHCHPAPKIPSGLLKFLATKFNAWHTVIASLEQRVLDPNNRAGFATDHNALGSLYKLLKEDDICYGLWMRRVSSVYSKAALAFEQFGEWSSAQDLLYTAMSKKSTSPGEIGIRTASRTEYIMWQQEWVNCATHLGQWEVLGDFSKSISHPEMQLESCWRLSQWSNLKTLVNKYPMKETPNAGKMYQIYLAIQQCKLQNREIDKLCEEGIQLALSEWRRYPRFVTNAHVSMLQRFQCLVELQESSQMLHDIKGYSTSGTMPQFKNFITTWRERLPNEWEQIPVWNDVLTWRQHMFEIICSSFQSIADKMKSYNRIHDKPWTLVKFASIARKQRLSSVCLSSLTKLYALPSIDAVDAFHKLREQVKVCLQSPMEIHAALNIISSTNLDYFNSEQKAELFRLKGEALQHLGLGDASNTAFSASLSVCDTYGKGWLSWGIFCDRVFTLKKDLQWADHAVVCYLQAVTHKSDRARFMLARVLWLLSFDREKGPVNTAFYRFSDLVPAWVWLIWIPQLLSSLARPEGNAVKTILCRIARVYPQSLYYTVRAYLIEKRELRNGSSSRSSRSSSSRSSSASASASASAAASAASGAADSTNKTAASSSAANGKSATSQRNATAMHSSNDSKSNNDSNSNNNGRSSSSSSGGGSHRSRTGSSSSSPSSPESAAQRAQRTGNFASLWVEDVVNVLRRSHPSLMTEIERMLDEFSRRFKPEPEEELLGAVFQLIIKCFKEPIQQTSDAIRPSLCTTIARVCRKFFTPDPSANNKKHLNFVYKYKESFERDFLPKSPHFPTTLTGLLARLRRWKHHLQYKVGNKSRIHLRLESSSPYLIRCQSYDIEIPGQYMKDQEPNTDQNVILQQFEPDVNVSHTHGSCNRRIGMRGSDGRVYYFSVQYSLSHITRSDERMMQLYVLMNRLMSKYKETRRRQLSYHVPLVVPLTHRLRLMETHKAQVSFEQVYEHSCAIRGVDMDEPLSIHRQVVRRAGIDAEASAEARLKVYDELSNTIVPDYMLSRYIHRSLPAQDQLWAFKREFGAQLALSGYLCYILKIGDRALHKLSFFRHSGRMVNSEFYPSYNEHCIIECHESVPFRLTRNMTTFLTPVLIDGIFSSVITTINSCLLHRQDIFKNYLFLFIRDDLLSWNATKISAHSDHAQQQFEVRNRDKIMKNVNIILQRIHMLMMSSRDIEPHSRGPAPPVNQKVHQLIAAATSKKNLVRMTPSWNPWF